MAAPTVAATTRFPHMASITTAPSAQPCPSRVVTSATTTPIAIPLNTPTSISFFTSSIPIPAGVVPSAIRRTVTASAWVPAFPANPAMIGINAARAMIRVIVSRNAYTTAAAKNAVTRLR